ncbi:ABC transporter permease, partial [Phytoactinopolyspora endophytica]|uniref:ABC transporter permease n=1 Tax=Phytoactinopolyspora endophytica TaxID=1642495 RepID=UPI00197B76BE
MANLTGSQSQARPSGAARRRYWLRRAGDSRLVRTFGPFVPVLLVWWLVAELELFSTAFFVGPGTVIAEFDEMIRKGILPAYLSDSLERLWFGVLFGLLIGIPAGFLVAMSRWARRLTWPLLMFFQAIADIAW